MTLRLDRLSDYLTLTKPRISLLALVTTALGYLLAVQTPTFGAGLFHVLFGTALVSGGAGVLNMWLEIGPDGRMERTRNRPLPAGRIQPTHALLFGIGLCVAGLGHLLLFSHPLAALLAALSLGIYVAIYTPLKTRTSLNTIAGAVPGALPPVIGWAGATGTLGLEALALFAILFLWQLPHFLAIAWIYRDDYARGGYKMLPVLDPEGDMTGRQAAIHCLGLLLVSLLPTIVGMAGGLYFLGAVLLGGWFLYVTIRFARGRTRKTARSVVLSSILYLPVLYGLMVFDKVPL